jgi:RimJ/RimL family protein N-acetyltransferase
MGFVVLAGARVQLGDIGANDLTSVAAWYDEAAGAAYEERSIEELRAGAVFAIRHPKNGEPIGLLEYRRDGGWMVIPFIALARDYRGWGYGSEAVRLVEEWAVREEIAARFRAEVDVHNGLGLYFWLRLGYRPASAGKFDWQGEEARDKMPMVREGQK